jgi:NADH-quinone oxidoreductase subunit L
MEGPTPVSSLLHSCTLVMAGVFTAFTVEVKATPLFQIILVLSMCFLILVSRPEKDVKRVVATSTVLMVGFL